VGTWTRRLARGDVAAGVGGADHLDGPLDDRRLGGGERRGEPTLRRAAGDRVEPVGADDDTALAELVRGAEPGGRRDERQRRHTLRVAQRQLDAHRAADRAAGVAEPLHAELVQGGEQPLREVADGRGGVRGRATVAGQVVPDHPPPLGELGDLPVPHVPGGTQ
jgi:hypothetical protein